jgi:hypothetical protein
MRWNESPDHLLALEDTLARFAVEEPRKAELVVLRFFAGMTIPELRATPRSRVWQWFRSRSLATKVMPWISSDSSLD